MEQAIVEYFHYVFHGIIGILLFKGLFVSPKSCPTDKEVIADLQKKLKQQRGMTIEANAGLAEISAAKDAQAKEYQRELHRLNEKYKKEMESERRKRPPIKMP